MNIIVITNSIYFFFPFLSWLHPFQDTKALTFMIQYKITYPVSCDLDPITTALVVKTSWLPCQLETAVANDFLHMEIARGTWRTCWCYVGKLSVARQLHTAIRKPINLAGIWKAWKQVKAL